MADIKDITKDNFDTDVLKSTSLALLYFYAPWCKQCQQAEEILDAAKTEAGEQVFFGRVNTDEEEVIITQQKVRTIPAFIIYHKGQVIDTLGGVPSKLELIGMLSNAISEHGEEGAAEATPPAEA